MSNAYEASTNIPWGKEAGEKNELTFVEQLQSSSISDLAQYHLLSESSAPSSIYFLPSWFHLLPNHRNQALKKSQPRLLALAWPHIRLVGRHFRFCLKKYKNYIFNIILFLHPHSHCHSPGPYSFSREITKLPLAVLPRSNLGFSKVIKNANIIMSFSCWKCFNDYRVSSQEVQIHFLLVPLTQHQR